MKNIFAGFLAILLTACVQSEIKREAPPQYGLIVTGDTSFFLDSKTFSWHPSLQKTYLNQDSLGEQVISRFQRSIEGELMRKGYQLSSNGSGDFIIGFGIAQESELSDEVIFDRTQLSTGLDKFYSEEPSAEKASVFMAFFTPHSPVPAWKVLAQGSMSRSKTEKEREQATQELAEFLLRKVPMH